MIDEVKKEKLEDLWLENYGEVFTDLFFDKYEESYGSKCYVVNDDVIAAIAYRPSEYVVNGKILRCSYIHRPIVKENYSFDYAKRLLEEVIEDLSKHEIISFIGLDHEKLYEELGFEKVYKKKKYILNQDNIPTLNNYNVVFDADEVDMLKCYGKFASYFNGYKLRNDKDFKELKEYKMSNGYKFVYFFKDNELKAYASYLDGDKVYVDEFVYLDSLSCVSIISYFIDEYKEIELTLGAAENLDFLSHNLKYEEYDFMLARINDYNAFNNLFNCNVNNTIQGYMLSRKHPFVNERY